MNGVEALNSLIEEKVQREDVAKALRNLPPEEYVSFCHAASPGLGLPLREEVYEQLAATPSEEKNRRYENIRMLMPSVGLVLGGLTGWVLAYYSHSSGTLQEMLSSPAISRNGAGLLLGASLGTLIGMMGVLVRDRKVQDNPNSLDQKCTEVFQEKVKEYIGRYS